MVGLTGVAARKTDALPNWFAISSLVVAPILAISGFAFPLNNGALLALLDLTLVLLLLWAGCLATLVARRTPAHAALTGSMTAT